MIRLCECGGAVEGHCWNFDASQVSPRVRRRSGLLPTEPQPVWDDGDVVAVRDPSPTFGIGLDTWGF